jgi:hypothetical protein
VLLQIRPRPPFDFELNATIFAGGDPQIRTYENGRYWQVLRVQRNLTLVTISSRGTVAEPELGDTLELNGKVYYAFPTPEKNKKASSLRLLIK